MKNYDEYGFLQDDKRRSRWLRLYVFVDRGTQPGDSREDQEQV